MLTEAPLAAPANLTFTEIAIIEVVRALELAPEEALRRLAPHAVRPPAGRPRLGPRLYVPPDEG